MQITKRSGTWLAITFILSWTLAFGFFAAGGTLHSRLWLLVAVVYMFIPAIATLAVETLFKKGDARSRLGLSFRPNWWFLVGLLAPAVLALLSTALSLAQPWVTIAAKLETANVFRVFGAHLPAARITAVKEQAARLPIHPFWLVLLGGTLAGLTVNGVAGFGEELGWRGFLQSEWDAWGFWKSSWLIGLLWGVWHAPFLLHGFNYPDHPIAGIFIMTLFTVLLAPLIGFVRLRSKSVFAAAIMHGAINGTYMAPALVLQGGSSLTTGVMGWPGIMVLAIANIALCLFGCTGNTNASAPHR
jgi:membrane protease YdiL (CAAX protease family)